jgi:DUF1009 family protein
MSAAGQASSLGLIAGAGGLPSEAIRVLVEAGESVSVVGFEGLTEASLETAVDSFRWLRLGQLEALADALHELGARRLLLVGKVPKTLLFSQDDVVDPDAEALRLLANLSDRGDDALLGALAEWLVEQGFELCDQGVVLAGLKAPIGPITRLAPDSQALSDLALGLPALRQLGRVGIGQCVVIKAGAVLAVEAIEGTDETIRRGGRLGGPGATVLKAARAHQDRRFDLPVVGPDTVSALVEARASALAIESDSVLLLDRERFVAEADRRGLVIWAFGAEGDSA